MNNCDSCWYELAKLVEYLYHSLTCPNCLRSMPNKKHRRRNGCKWCTPKKDTKYCNGKY